MPIPIPPPTDWRELEQYIARFARRFLNDPHAATYGKQGQGQHGLDVIARDQRPGGSGRLWVFQAKNYITKGLHPAALEEMAKLLEKFPHRADVETFVVVTTADVSTSVKNKALELTKREGIKFEVWDWTHFTDLMVDYIGSGQWLSRAERLRLRENYCGAVRAEFQDAGPLYPLPAQRPSECDIRLQDVLVPPLLRLLPDDARGHVPKQESKPSVELPPRYEGTLRDWCTPDRSEKPFLLVIAPMGAGKTVALLKGAADMADVAAKTDDAPLPLMVTAKDLADGRLDDTIRRMPFDSLVSLWNDPMTSWILLVDALDEVENERRQRVVRELASVRQRDSITAIVVTCRDSHSQPRLLPGSTRLELPPWRESDWSEFWSRWSHTHQEQGSATDTRLSSLAEFAVKSNPLNATLFAKCASESDTDHVGRAWLFRRLVDGLFRQWAKKRGISAWENLREAFEYLALDSLAHGGRPLPHGMVESILARLVGDDEVDATITTAAQHLGIVRRTADGSWEIPLRAVAEYLAAGAILRHDDDFFVDLAGQPWASEAVQLALDRCWNSAPQRALALLMRLLQTDLSDKNVLLCRSIVALRSARDRVRESAQVALEIARHLVDKLVDETSEWRRRRVGEEVHGFALDGGPIWDALWEMLKPILANRADRASWYYHYGDGDAAYWMAKLHEQDPAVRVVANERLTVWKNQEDVQGSLLWELLDAGHSMDSFPWRRPALAAASVLRGISMGDDVLQFIRRYLKQRSSMAEVAAVALSPNAAEPDILLGVLKDAISRGLREPAFYQAIASHRENQASIAWLEKNWPEALEPSFAPPEWGLPPPGDEKHPPISQYVRRDLLSCIAPALRWPEVREHFGPEFYRGNMISAICSIADIAPEPAIEFLKRGKHIFIHASDQLLLGQAALRHPQLAEALINRWLSGADADVPSSFPGIALDALASRGDSSAAKIYAEWLPSMPFMMPLGAWQPPSRGALSQTVVREAAKRCALDAWDYAVHGQPDTDGQIKYLYPGTLALHLRGLWPVWEEVPEIREWLLEKCPNADEEWFEVILFAWMEGEFPSEVIDDLLRRLNQPEWPSTTFFANRLATWLQAAMRAGILPRIQSLLIELAEGAYRDIVHQAASYLVLIQPDKAKFWSERAATVAPFFWHLDFTIEPDDEERLLSAAPEVWARRSLELYRNHGYALGLQILRTIRRVWNRIADPVIRGEIADVARGLVNYPLVWASADMRPNNVVSVGDAAEELLFMMGEPIISIREDGTAVSTVGSAQ